MIADTLVLTDDERRELEKDIASQQEEIAYLAAENATLRTENEQLLSRCFVYSATLDALRTENDRLRAALSEMVKWFGVFHDDNCPEDDTCNCKFAAQVNAALAARRETP